MADIEPRSRCGSDRSDNVSHQPIAQIHALSPERIERDRGVADRHHYSARRQPAHRLAHRRDHRSDQPALGVSELDVGRPRGIPWHELADHCLGHRNRLLACLAALEPIHLHVPRDPDRPIHRIVTAQSAAS